MKKYIRILAALLALLLIIPSLISCNSQPIKASKNSLRAVGTVGDFEVKYEELYFLVQLYRDELDLIYGENAATSSEKITVEKENGETSEVVLSEHYANELRSRVYENIISNYSVLALAKDAGLTFDDKAVEDEIQSKLDHMIEEDFEGSRSAYKDFLKDKGMTDDYVRFSLGVDVLYASLLSYYIESGVIDDSDSTVRTAVDEEFIRTWHIMILNEDKDRDNKGLAEEALEKINGGASMYEMIGSKYNEDFLLTTLDGYYFTKGVMDANAEQNALLREEISILRKLLDKDTTVTTVVSTGDVIDGFRRKNRRDGKTTVPVGV